jgi:hypothetical protein
MALFVQNFLSFPVSIYSGLLVIVTLYWLVAALGIFNIDSFDLDGSDALDAGGDELSGEGLAGLLLKLGLSGVPVTIVITFLTLFGWLISYFSVHLFLRFIDSTLIRYLLGSVIFILTTGVAIYLTSIVIRPLRSLFKKLNATTTAQTLIGQTVEIRSSSVTESNGQAIYEDGGAGMIIQVRSTNGNDFKRGDRAVILSFDSVNHCYQIITENEFRGR